MIVSQRQYIQILNSAGYLQLTGGSAFLVEITAIHRSDFAVITLLLCDMGSETGNMLP